MLLSPISVLTLHFFQEYLEDGIDWANVEFVDNADCLTLFEKVSSVTFMESHNFSECTWSVWNVMTSEFVICMQFLFIWPFFFLKFTLSFNVNPFYLLRW
jgi:hypothetical protein